MANVSTRDAFKLGFIQRCVEEGMTPEQTYQHMEKVASIKDTIAQKLRDLATGSAQGLKHYVQSQAGPEGMAVKKWLDLENGPKRTYDKLRGEALNTGAKNMGSLKNLAIALGIGVPAIGGFMAGSTLKKLQGNVLTPEEIQKQEMINEYNAMARKAKLSGSAALEL